MFQSVSRRHKFIITYIKIRVISKITYFRTFRMVKEIMEIDIKQKMTEKRTLGDLCVNSSQELNVFDFCSVPSVSKVTIKKF